MEFAVDDLDLDLERYPDNKKLISAFAYVKSQENQLRNANALSRLQETLTDRQNRFSADGWKLRNALLRRIQKVLKGKQTKPPEAGRMKFNQKHPFQIKTPRRRYDVSQLPRIDGSFLMDDDEQVVSLAKKDFESVSTVDLLKYSKWARSKKRRFSHAGSSLSNAIHADIESFVDKKVFAGKKFQVFRMDAPVAAPVALLGSEPKSDESNSNYLPYLITSLLLLVVALGIPSMEIRNRMRKQPPSSPGGAGSSPAVPPAPPSGGGAFTADGAAKQPPSVTETVNEKGNKTKKEDRRVSGKMKLEDVFGPKTPPAAAAVSGVAPAPPSEEQ